MKLLTSIAAGVIALASAASATTIMNVSGTVVEGGVPVSGVLGAPASPDFSLGDFNTTATDPTLEIVGDTTIFGAVAHRITNREYVDAWAMDFGSMTYEALFSWVVTSSDFDGQVTADGTQVLSLDNTGGLNESLGTFTGLVEFNVDPIFGQLTGNPDEVAQWRLELVKVAPVPLPAGGALMLAGLAGFAAMKRRTKS